MSPAAPEPRMMRTTQEPVTSIHDPQGAQSGKAQGRHTVMAQCSGRSPHKEAPVRFPEGKGSMP